MKWILVYRQKFIRPFWYINYSKETARQELITKTGWQYYGGHHLENRASEFAHTVWLPKKFKIDLRNLTLAANVRRGVMDKKTALSLYNQTIVPQLGLIDYVKKRIDISDTQYQQIMTGPIRTWRNFYTYKKRFERLRPLFYLLAKANLVPTSFYLKYCFPEKIT
jgi:hypothetical protein